MRTECISEQYEFEAFDKRRAVAAFDGGAIGTDTGAVLLRYCDRAIRLFDRVASCFIDHRTPELVAHEFSTLVGQRICGIALGYEDLNDHARLRHNLFADCTSAATMRANQLRLWFASLAYVPVDSLRRIALTGTQLANATASSLRLKLLKIGARVTVSVRRIKIAMTSAQPWRREFSIAHEQLSEIVVAGDELVPQPAFAGSAHDGTEVERADFVERRRGREQRRLGVGSEDDGLWPALPPLRRRQHWDFSRRTL